MTSFASNLSAVLPAVTERVTPGLRVFTKMAVNDWPDYRPRRVGRELVCKWTLARGHTRVVSFLSN